MASDPITSWEIDGETVESVSDFIFPGSKITADGDCSHEINRCLFLGRKLRTNLDSILKSRDITLPIKVCVVKAMVFQILLWPPLWQKVKRNWKASWWKWKRRVKKLLKAQHSENKDHGIWSHHFMGNRWGNSGNSVRLYFLGFPNHCRWWLQPWN